MVMGCNEFMMAHVAHLRFSLCCHTMHVVEQLNCLIEGAGRQAELKSCGAEKGNTSTIPAQQCKYFS